MPRPEQIQFLIYPPSKELLEEWRSESKKKGTSLNNYVVEMVEKSRRSDNSDQRRDLSKELSGLKEENAKLRNELRIKELILQKYESELYVLRNKAFSDPDQQGPREYDEKLVVALRRGRPMDERALYSELGIDPRDAEAIKLVSNQLKGLIRYGLIEETSRGWRWIK
jgi:hypothetical protein